MYKHNPNRFADLAVNALGVDGTGKADEQIALEGIEFLEDYFRSIGMPVRLSELGLDITQEDIENMSEKCTFYGKRTLKDYISLGKEEITEIFKISM